MNDIDLVVLALAAETPRYAHEMQQVFHHRGLQTWVSMGETSLFYVIDQLKTRGFIQADGLFEQIQPTRQRYTSTQTGQALLHTALADRLSQAPPGSSRLDIGLLFAHLLGPEEVHRLLEKRRIDLHHRMQSTEERLHQLEHGHPLHRALLERLHANIQQDITWTQHFQAYWQQQSAHPEVPSPAPDKPPAPNRLQKVRRPTPNPDE